MKHIKFYRIVTILLLMMNCHFHVSGVSTHPYYKVIDSRFGLPSQNIYSLHVSSNGLLFLGTDKGLFSYDGVRFKHYSFKNNLANSVDRVQEDEQGRIWCKNFSNQIFYLENDVLIPHLPSQQFCEKNKTNLADYLIVEKGLFVITEKQIALFQKDGTIRVIDEYANLDVYNTFFSIDYDPLKNLILVGSLNYIHRIDHDLNTTLIPVKLGQKMVTLFNSSILYGIRGANAELYVSHDQKTFQKINVDPSNYIVRVAATSVGYWLCTANGVHTIDVGTNKLTESYFLGHKITDVVEDLEGNLWFSTIGDGLFIVPSLNIKKVNISVKTRQKPNITTLKVDDNGSLFAGSLFGIIYELDSLFNTIRQIETGKNKEVEHIDITEHYLLTSDGKFDRTGKKLKFNLDSFKTITEDEYGNYFLGTYGSAAITSKEGNRAPEIGNYFSQEEYESNSYDNIFIIHNKRTRAVLYVDKIYYTGASNGLFIFGPNYYRSEIKTFEGKPIIVSDMKTDQYNNVWVASIQYGVLKIKGDKIIAVYDEKAGLSNNGTRKICIDKDGVWVAGDGGLDRINFHNNSIAQLSQYSGLHGISITNLTTHKDKLFLLTEDGILTLNKSEFDTPYIPTFAITTATARDKSIEPNSVIRHNENDVTFSLQTIHYRSLGNYHYEYRLLGHSQAWITQPSNVQQVNYLSLDPGSYTFQARVKIGQTYTDLQQFSFTILKPYWLSFWFIALIAFLTILVLYILFQWQIDIVRKRQSIKEQLAHSQITALRSQMNPHFMFNILNAFQGLIYSNQKTKANEYLGVFSDLMRKTLDLSDKREISIVEELEAIELYIALEKARFAENEFLYTFETEYYEELRNYTIPSLIIQPFIENAIKHGLMHKTGEKKLKLSISNEDAHYWRFEIKDNGIGREQSLALNKTLKKYKSFATKAIDNRIDLINKLNSLPILISIIDLKNKDFQSTGTKVIIKIPKKQATK